MKFILLLASLFFFSACKESSRPVKNVASFVGKWKPIEMEVTGMDKNEIQNALENFVMEFTNDGNYLGTINSEKQTGSYTFNKENNELTITNNNSPDQPVQTFIVKWDKDLLILENKEGKVKLRRE